MRASRPVSTKETRARRIERGARAPCEKLGIKTGAPLLSIGRVGFVDDEAVMVEYTHWRADVDPG